LIYIIIAMSSIGDTAIGLVKAAINADIR